MIVGVVKSSSHCMCLTFNFFQNRDVDTTTRDRTNKDDKNQDVDSKDNGDDKDRG